MGKSRNVTNNSPTRLGALRATLSYPKYDGVSWVWSTIVILVKVKCYVTRPYLSWLRTVAPNIYSNVDGEVAYAAPINGLAVGYIQV